MSPGGRPLDDVKWCRVVVLVSNRSTPRPPATYERHPHMRLHQEVLASGDALMKRDRSALHLFRRGRHLQHIVHACGLEKLDLHRAHHEGEARCFLLRFLEQAAMTGTEQAQMIGASALHEAQIIGVIDDAGKISVLVINPDGHDVPAGVDFAVKRGRGRAHSNPTLRFTLARRRNFDRAPMTRADL